MTNKSFKKVLLILMAAFLVVAVTPVVVTAGEVNKSIQKQAVKPDKKLQDNIAKTEKQITTLKKEITAKQDKIDTVVSDELIPLIFDIAFTLEDAGLELEEDVSADMEKRSDAIDATMTSISDNLDALDANYKKAQGIKKKNPTGYLKELQKIVSQYGTVKQQFATLDKQINEYISVLETVFADVEKAIEEDQGDQTKDDEATPDEDVLDDANTPPTN